MRAALERQAGAGTLFLGTAAGPRTLVIRARSKKAFACTWGQTEGGRGWEGGEFLLSNAAFRYAREALDEPPEAFDAARLSEIRRKCDAAKVALGPRHWATARLAAVCAQGSDRSLLATVAALC